jgi:TrmH family RNA methyltransferase
MIITSYSNPKVKFIRKLEQKKYRQETGLFFIEGLHTVGEAVQTAAPIVTLVIAPELLESDFGQSLLENPNVKDIEQLQVSAEIYQKIAHKEGPQGIGAIIKQDWVELEDIEVKPGDLWIALDAVADPGNLGTIMRTADAVGCRGIILLGHATDPHDPTAVKASMGALFSLKLIQSSWQQFTQWKDSHRLSLVGTSDHAETDYQAINYRRPLVLLMGSERHGLSSEMMIACDHLVQIPMVGRSDSLNLAVASAVMLYEIFNQNRKLEMNES